MINIFNKDIDKQKYFVVKYFLKGRTSLRDAAWNLAIGQSIGNPNNRSVWETEKMFELYEKTKEQFPGIFDKTLNV